MAEGFQLALLGVLAALLLAAAVVDLKKREIPHIVVIAIGLLAIPFWWTSGLSLWPEIAIQLALGAAVLAVFTIMFAFGWMGGGDVKLLAVLALWLPWQALVTMLIIMSLAGAVVTVATLIWSRMRDPSATPEVPYGVAIAFAGISLIGQRFLNQFG